MARALEHGSIFQATLSPASSSAGALKRSSIALPRQKRHLIMASQAQDEHDRPNPWRFIRWSKANEQQARSIAGESGDEKKGNFTYKVVPGETLADIAAKFNTRIEVIMEANRVLNPNNVAGGELLWIPRTYEIVKGDTLYSLARKFGVEMAAIQAANGIDDPNLIYAGDVVVIPDDEYKSKG